ncbi:unnamed protein product [Fusarium equiseti]|uniref:Peptidase A1 domain-containing protein n=1 Tax=Fusarium equiseti TaxID=61235 RepID=A0A8J2N917_FUSEQ|nr:unnamed protein product [Fusarium equiseti]
MLSALFLAVAAPAIATAVNVPNVPVSDNTPEGMVRFPLKVSTGGPVVKGITKRQNEVLLESQQNGFFYSIDVTLGTPGDKVTVNLDTGSAELWVNPVCEKAQQPQFCANFGHFGESSTFVDLNTTGGVVYGTGYAYWNYGYDHVVIGSASIRNQVFGVAYDSSFTGVGIMGAGPDLNGWNAPYPLVIDSMVRQNLIKSRVLSLDIRTLDSDRGAVIFGGIDTKKYTGRLQKLPIIPAADSPDGLTRYWVNLDGISLKQQDGSVDAVFAGSQPVLLDSGYTVSALPGAIFNKIVDNFPTAKRNGGAYVDVDCSVADIKGTVDFTFAGKTIKVPYADFIWHNEERCVLGVFQDDEFPVLGDTFLRAAYVVYDWDNREVWIANNEDCGTNLVAVGTGPNAVPDLEGECGSDETSTSAIETATSTEMETVTATTEVETDTEIVTATVTTDVTESVPSDTTTVYFSTTRYSNTTVAWTDKVISSYKPTGGDYDLPPIYTKVASSDYDVPSYTKSGSGDHYNKPSYTDSAPSTTVTSTVVTSMVYTVTACPPSVTNCPVGQVTTETITSLTTFCPGPDGSPTDKAVAPHPTNGPLTSYVTATNMHTITSCSGKDACHTSVVTEIVHNTQGAGAEPTGIFTIPEAIQCGNGNFGCKEATTKGYRTITVTNVVKAPKPTPVPGYCSTCGPLGEGFTKVPGGHHTGDSNQPGGHHTGGSNKPTGAHPTNAYPQPTGEAPKPDSPEHGDESPKPNSDSPHSGGDAPKPNPLEELHTYRPTNVYPIIPTSNIATVVKPTGTPQPEAPTGTPVAISGASSWNVPVVAAVVLGAVVAVL